MLLGTYWCQLEKSWVRFIVENEKVRAEVARISLEDPRITMDWEKVPPAELMHWKTSYAAGNLAVQITYFALQNSSLFKTDGRIIQDKLTASQYRRSEWYPYNVIRGNPFENFELSPEAELPDYRELPLTPEMLDQRRRELEAEAARLKEAEERKWTEWRRRDIRRLVMADAAGEDPIIGEDKLEDALMELNGALLEIVPANPYYSNCAAYLQELKSIIEDKNNQFHKRILVAASATHIDREVFEEVDESLRQALLEFKKSFYFNVLRDEAALLSREFGIDCPILSAEELAEQAEEQPALEEHEEDGFGPSLQEDEQDSLFVPIDDEDWDGVGLESFEGPPVQAYDENAAFENAIAESLKDQRDRGSVVPLSANTFQSLPWDAFPEQQREAENPFTLDELALLQWSADDRDYQPPMASVVPRHVSDIRVRAGDSHEPPSSGRRHRTQAAAKVVPAINKKEFDRLFDELKLKTDNLIDLGNVNSKNFNPDYVAVGQQARLLNKSLNAAAQTYFAQEATEARTIAFKEQCVRAIGKAKKEFGHHRGWGDISVVVRAIIGFFAFITVLPGLIVAFNARHGFFSTFGGNPPTESLSCLEDFETKLIK